MMPWRYGVCIVILNIGLSGLHKLLDFIQAKKKESWSDNALKLVISLQKILEWLMANRK